MLGVWRVKRLARRMRAVLRSRGLVLLYHRVAHTEPDPWELAVSPENFAAHMRILAGYRPMSLDCLLSQRRTPKAGSVAVTFDDGYVDNLTNAKPILESQGIPATFFITTSNLSSGCGYWWEQLQRTVLCQPALSRRIDWSAAGASQSWSLKTIGERRQALLELHDRLKRMPAADRSEALSEIIAQFDPPCDSEEARPMTEEELRQLASEDRFDIGAHTVTHPFLPALTDDDMARELRDSGDYLRAITGKPVTSFSYPYGATGADRARVAAAVRSSGFRTACTAEAGLVAGNTSAYFVPRLPVPNLAPHDFAKLMSWYLEGLE